VGILSDILDSKRREVRALQAVPRRGATRAPLPVVERLRRGQAGLRLLAEVKRRSPSAGPLSRVLAPGERAVAYARAGAAAVSVLCDGPFFDGSWDHLAEARAALDEAGLAVPLLAKEFVLDARQIGEARDRGADAVLLIARIVDEPTLVALAEAARAEGLEPLVEIAHPSELPAARAAGARLVGVNARDLDTLAMDAAGATRLLASLERDVVAVHLSGVRTVADVVQLTAGRADAALVGEVLMREDDPAPLLRTLVGAGRG